MGMNTKAANARQASPMSRAIAAQIRAERAASNLTKDEVHKRAGISRTTYYKLESGERILDVSQLAAICEVLGITMTELLTRAEDRLGAASAGEGEQRGRGHA